MERISELEPYLAGIVIGVRYRANFAVDDQLGRIVDQILYKKNSFFNFRVFPNVSSGINDKALENNQTNDRLRIDNSNIVLQINFPQFGGKFTNQDLPKIADAFEKEILNGVMSDFRIRELNRIGLIRRYVFTVDDLARVFVDKTIGRTLQGVNDINLRFSKRIPSIEGVAMKGVNDYNNAIFNIIRHTDRPEIFMAVDYQKYFDPFLASASELKYQDFLSHAESFSKRSFLPWINENFIEESNEQK